jgi:hypothetical protein
VFCTTSQTKIKRQEQETHHNDALDALHIIKKKSAPHTRGQLRPNPQKPHTFLLFCVLKKIKKSLFSFFSFSFFRSASTFF